MFDEKVPTASKLVTPVDGASQAHVELATGLTVRGSTAPGETLSRLSAPRARTLAHPDLSNVGPRSGRLGPAVRHRSSPPDR